MQDFFETPETSSSTIQSQPHNRQAEEAVLGSVLINPESYFDVAQVLDADYFYIIRNRWIWEVFTHLHENRIPIDILTLSEELENRGQLEEIGGQAYLMMLINQTPSSLNAAAYAHIVEETSVRRRMLAAANEMAKLAYQEEKPVEDIINSAEKSIFDLSERRIRRDLQPIQNVIDEYYDRVSMLSQRSDEIFGVPTGLTDLDKLLGGLQRSDLLIIAGRPGTGKTGFLLTIAKNAALKHKKHVAMFSLEMSNEQLVQRMIAQDTGINTQELRSGKIQDDHWDILTQSMENLSNSKIYLDDTPALTPIQMRTKCRRLHLEHHIDLILVDYIQLMSGDTRNDNRVQEVSYISRNLKTLARELNVPVLAAAQLSRAVEQRTDKKPMLSDLRESGSLEQDADIVMFIHKKEDIPGGAQDKELIELMVAKHRNGPTRDIEMVFIKNLAQFYDVATVK
ncbi:MAG: replicative DNA helicase [Anaerolineae bacterium]|jgi:replicative DNA helicase|nr:replicative DNA helicase [Anaerolineae bacterium]